MLMLQSAASHGMPEDLIRRYGVSVGLFVGYDRKVLENLQDGLIVFAFCISYH